MYVNMYINIFLVFRFEADQLFHWDIIKKIVTAVPTERFV